MDTAAGSPLPRRATRSSSARRARTTSTAWSTRSCTRRSRCSESRAALAALIAMGAAGSAAAPAGAATRHVLGRGGPRELEHRAQPARRDHGRPLRPVGDRLRHGRLPPLHAATGSGRCATCRPARATTTGCPGPLIRARAGDRIRVHFKNLDTTFRRPHSMHFHGVRYKPSSDGAYVPGFSGGDADVKPGKTWTYKLTALRLSRRRLALPRPLALDARVDRRRHVGDALDPRPPRARARPRVRRRVLADRAASRASTAARSSATRPCSPRSPASSCSGT